MKDDSWKDEPRREKETMTEPQEEFLEIQSRPSQPKKDDEHPGVPGREGSESP